MGFFDTAGKLWALARKVEELFVTQGKHGTSIKEMAARLEEMEKRVAALEQREELLTERARSAAKDGAHQAMGEVWRAVGALEADARANGTRPVIDSRPARPRLPRQPEE
ncbi:hypothetical protein VQH23_02720 [Pararoseomonas sp. SCSIO 73927]|uniref:hypothetical protein n=1 Tax=Pararoseomonas sp. SCSIO 73927 TaxID=3114537 RepID=UPI0030CDFB13